MKSGKSPISNKCVLLMLHGFTGAPYDFQPLLDQSNHWDVHYFARLPGHITGKPVTFDPSGEWERFIYGLDFCFQEAIRQGIRVYVLAYSMGARLWLKAYLERKWGIAGMFLIGVNPGLVNNDEREVRSMRDRHLAESLRQEGTSRFIDSWMQQPLIRTQLPHVSDEVIGHKKRLNAEALAWALETYSPGVLPSLWDELGEWDAPTVLISGEMDSKFSAIHERMLSKLKYGFAGSVKEAGHAPHIENPHGLAKVMDACLANTD